MPSFKFLLIFLAAGIAGGVAVAAYTTRTMTPYAHRANHPATPAGDDAAPVFQPGDDADVGEDAGQGGAGYDSPPDAGPFDGDAAQGAAHYPDPYRFGHEPSADGPDSSAPDAAGYAAPGAGRADQADDAAARARAAAQDVLAAENGT